MSTRKHFGGKAAYKARPAENGLVKAMRLRAKALQETWIQEEAERARKEAAKDAQKASKKPGAIRQFINKF